MSDKYERVHHGNHHKSDGKDGYVYNCRRSETYTLKSHLHECFEFVYITEGTCVYTVEGTEFVVSAGDMIFTAPNEIHSFSFPQKGMFYRQFLHVYPNYITEFPEIMQYLTEQSAARRNLIPSYLVKQYELDRYFKDLRQYRNIDRSETFMMAKSCAMGLIAKISEILRNGGITHTSHFQNKHINNIMQYISLHHSQPVTLSDIAAEVHVSSVYASKLFKKETGMTLKSYINMCRIVNAKNLILAGEKIIELPEKCGFENYSTFYRAFVKYAGISPDDFKKANK